DAPVIDLNGAGAGNDATASFTEQTPLVIAPLATVTDVDSANLTSLTATLTARPDGNGVESLSLNASATAAASGLTVLYTASTGVLSITGSASQATYQTILDGIVYNNTSDTPTTAARTVNVVSSDGTDSSVSHSVTISVTPVNDAPVIDLNGALAGTSTSINYTAGSAAAAIAPSATVTDVDSVDFNSGSLTVAFTANGASTDQLTIQNQGVAAGQIGVSGSNVTFGGTVIGTFTGGTNGTNLVVTFNAAATQAATQALADHILYSNASGATTTKTVTYTLVDGDGGTDTGTATATINVTGGGQAPIVDLNGPGAGNDATASYPTGSNQLVLVPAATVSDVDSSNIASMTITLTNPQDNSSGAGGVREILSLNAAATAAAAGLTVSFTSSVANNTDPVTLSITGSATKAIYQTILDGVQYTDTKNGNHSSTARIVTVVVNDGTTNSVSHTVTISVAAPAGVAGEPINLALANPSASTSDQVSVTITGAPADWTINGATKNADGSWTAHTSDPSSLTVMTPDTFTGAAVLTVTQTWTNQDGSAGRAIILDNVEVFAPASPIFAVSAEDHLTGSTGADLFVFGQPISADTLHNFDVGADKIDLIGFAGVNGFADLAIADDGSGSALISVGAGETITVHGVSASELGAGNFLFNQEPVTHNAGTMSIGDDAIMPLGGTIDNTGTIALNGAGSTTQLEVIASGITLQGGGQIVLSDSDANVISGAAADNTFTNVDNTISGAGQLGGGSLSLNNQGTIIATGSHALVIDTGGSTVVNSGTLEATGSGGLTINGALANTGLIWANGGDIEIGGQVTGDGDAIIGNMSQLEFHAASSTDVIFAADAAGTLQLDDSFDFSGSIAGITNDDKVDLGDILFGTGTSAVYQANQDGSGGTLVVSDGTHDATLHLVGAYDANSFTLADDGTGRTVIGYHPADGFHFV
ncbi:adhesin, partial [Mesorhizobium sp. M1050]